MIKLSFQVSGFMIRHLPTVLFIEENNKVAKYILVVCT
jgi:hypothetical protein